MNEIKLLPCPFCGSEKVSVRTKTKNHYAFHKYIIASVRCNICNARGSAIGKKIQLGKYGEESREGITYKEEKEKLLNKAKEAWNSRIA